MSGESRKGGIFFHPRSGKRGRDYAMKMHLKNPHFYLMLLADAILFAVALVLAYLFRFEFSLDAFFAEQLKRIWIPILFVKLSTFFLFGLYQGMWRYTSTRDFWRLLQASATATLLIMA